MNPFKTEREIQMFIENSYLDAVRALYTEQEVLYNLTNVYYDKRRNFIFKGEITKKREKAC